MSHYPKDLPVGKKSSCQKMEATQRTMGKLSRQEQNLLLWVECIKNAKFSTKTIFPSLLPQLPKKTFMVSAVSQKMNEVESGLIAPHPECCLNSMDRCFRGKDLEV